MLPWDMELSIEDPESDEDQITSEMIKLCVFWSNLCLYILRVAFCVRWNVGAMHFACLGGAEAQLGQCANDTLRKALHLTEQLMVLG